MILQMNSINLQLFYIANDILDRLKAPYKPTTQGWSDSTSHISNIKKWIFMISNKFLYSKKVFLQLLYKHVFSIILFIFVPTYIPGAFRVGINYPEIGIVVNYSVRAYNETEVIFGSSVRVSNVLKSSDIFQSYFLYFIMFAAIFL